MFVPEIITGLRSFFYPNCTHILTNRAINSGPVFVHTLVQIAAYDSEGNESGYSNQVSTADKDNPDISRSAWSDNSGTEATGCFIQSTK